MKDAPISEREFLRFETSMTKVLDAQAKNSESMIVSIKGIESTLGKLAEYQIHNDTKHDKTNEEIKELTSKDVATNKRIDDVNEAVIANTRVSSFWRTVGKYSSKILIGVLTTMGAIIAYTVFG